MNKKLALLAAGALVAGAFQVQAVTVSGSIDIGAFGSSVIVNKTANTVTFVDSNPAPGNAIVNNATGNFTPFFGQFATYANFGYDPLAVANPLWNLVAPGVASFNLLALTTVDEAGPGLVLTGTGVINVLGFDPTPGTWSFSADSAGALFTFSSQTVAHPPRQVPDGGATAMLLGLGVLGLAGLRRKLS